ncbi:MAG: hypothetical protein IT290_07080 [Deltaproteobacteria bacterium]|nr:hypothetical protein [Deltaproteobacteria bacterium]
MNALPQGADYLAGKLDWLPKVGVVWLLLCALIVRGWFVMTIPFGAGYLPWQAIDEIVERDNPESLLTPFDLVPFAIFRLADARGDLRNPVPIDQTNLATNPEAVRDALVFFRTGQGEILRRLNPYRVLCLAGTAGCEALASSSAWEQIYEDEHAPSLGQKRRFLPTWRVYQRLAVEDAS